MIERGAKHLAFMSRSGADSRSAAALIESIEARGVTATVIRGDVTAIADVKAAVKEAGTVHPVRGVVHAAMVLEVSSSIVKPVTFANSVCFRMECSVL